MSTTGKATAIDRGAFFRQGWLVAEVYRVDGGFDRRLFSGASCAFGVFDGVHEGHRYLLGQARAYAHDAGGVSIALTFDRDPDEVFHAERLKKLMTNERRICALGEAGVDVVVVLPFTRAFAALDPMSFLEKTFDGTPPAFLHVGCDFRFGSRALGTVRELEGWGRVRDMLVVAHDLKAADGQPITATRIRLLLSEGKVEEASRLLGRPYEVSGTVEQGRGEGRAFGFKTANLHIPDQLRAIGDGVYAAWAEVDGERYKAAVNVGVPATFADASTATCEAHLLDFDADLYGQSITVEFRHWLRPMRKFDDVEELVATVKSNIAWVRDNL